MSNKELNILLIKAIVFGVIWGLTFYCIRKGLNPRNFVKDAEAKRESFYWDAVYGGLAAAVAVVAKDLAMVQIKKFS
jgi:hypothetical protein